MDLDQLMFFGRNNRKHITLCFYVCSSHCVVLSGFSESKVQAGEPRSFLLISLLFIYWNLRLEADTVDANPSEPRCFQSACAGLSKSSSH